MWRNYMQFWGWIKPPIKEPKNQTNPNHRQFQPNQLSCKSNLIRSPKSTDNRTTKEILIKMKPEIQPVKIFSTWTLATNQSVDSEE